MKKYKGCYIDKTFFRNEAEIDEFLKQQAIREYKIRCQVFATNKDMGSGIYADEQAEKLNREYGIGWEELEQMEIEAYKTA